MLPEKALLWRETLIVADAHLGKAAAMRHVGLPIPSGTTQGTLDRLGMLLDRVRPKRLILLGDLWHARAGKRQAEATLLAWRLGRSDLEIVLVEGNHDLRSGQIEPQARISELPELEEPPFVFLHHPQQRAQAFVICGHIHPCVHLGGRARERLRLPCFWATQDFLVLPAFGEFTGCARVEPSPSDRIFVTDGVSVKQVTNRGAVAG